MPIAEIGALVKKELQEAQMWDDAYDGEKKEWYLQTLDMIRDRFHTLKDFTTLGRAYFADDFEIEEAALTKNLRKYPELKNWLPMLADRFAALPEFTKDSVEQAAREFAEEIGVKPGIPINASRAVITGLVKGPSMFELFVHMGREKVVARLRNAGKYFA
jgi:glutamyl/glutaminyl-tRNA synthetase